MLRRRETKKSEGVMDGEDGENIKDKLNDAEAICHEAGDERVKKIGNGNV